MARVMTAAWPVPELLLLGVAAIWGASYSAVKYATLHLPVLEFLSLRFALTLLLLLPALWPLLRPGGLKQVGVGALLGLNLLAIFLCETFGVTLTSAAHAAFLVSLSVPFTPLLQWWLLRQPPSPATLWATAASLLGAVLLAWQPGLAAFKLGMGELLMVAAALLRALMVCMTRRLNENQQIPALTLTALQAAMIALGASGLSWAATGSTTTPLPESSGFWWVMGFLVLCCTVFAFFAQNYAASRASPSRVSLLMASEPVFGALVAVLWLGEVLSPLGWLGGLLIVGAALFMLRPEPAR